MEVERSDVEEEEEVDVGTEADISRLPASDRDTSQEDNEDRYNTSDRDNLCCLKGWGQPGSMYVPLEQGNIFEYIDK